MQQSEQTVMYETEKIYADRLLNFALDIGSNILMSGGEINRAENTIEHICTACGASNTEVFAITSIISVSITFPDGLSVSQSRRIARLTNNLKRIEDLNRISRELCNGIINLDTAIEQTSSIIHKKENLDPKILFGAGLAAGSFALFFGGKIADAVVSFLIGMFMIVCEYKRPYFMNRAMQTIFSCFVAGVFSLGAYIIGLPIDYNYVIIGAIMIVIPGIAIGNALKELLLGDTISGALRIIQSILMTVLIALGFAAAFMLLGRWL